MVTLETLWEIGYTLLNRHIKNACFDMQDEIVVSELKLVDASQNINPERIFCRCGETGLLAGKILVYSDDNFQDVSRYLPLPFLNPAKECQDYIRAFCCDEELKAYHLEGMEEFRHDYTNFERIIGDRERCYIAKAYLYLDAKVSELELTKKRKEYRKDLGKQWCEMHGISYEK